MVPEKILGLDVFQVGRGLKVLGRFWEGTGKVLGKTKPHGMPFLPLNRLGGEGGEGGEGAGPGYTVPEIFCVHFSYMCCF